MASFPRKMDRREALASLGASVGAAAIAACGGSPTAADATTTTTTTTNNSTCAVSPTETRGPYPDTVGMIDTSAFFRRDITEGKKACR